MIITESSLIPQTLFFAEHPKFEEHLQFTGQEFKSNLASIFSKLPQTKSSATADLESRLSQLLAAEKVHLAELERTTTEKNQLEERLENATLRYLRAESKAARAKSAAVALIETKGLVGSKDSAGESSNTQQQEGSKASNGEFHHDEAAVNAELERSKAVAVLEKQKELLAQLESDNEKLTERLTSLTIKTSRLSDEDYAKTDLFKLLKSQHEDVVNRVNNLEALNKQLREEAEKLQAERTAYRSLIDSEAETTRADLESRLIRAETDLTRIRSGRDEYLAELTIKSQAEENDRKTLGQTKELAEARQNQITALESEVERLKHRLNEGNPDPQLLQDVKSLSSEDLITKYTSLQQQYAALEIELSSIGPAIKKYSSLALKKVLDTTAVEEKIARLQAEKSKADQKYFATMKAKELQDGQLKTLQSHNQKSAGIVTQLKEAETAAKTYQISLEKQIAELKSTLLSATDKSQSFQQQVTEKSIAFDGLKSQVRELKEALSEKDSSFLSAKKAQRIAETQVESLGAENKQLAQEARKWQDQAMAGAQEEMEMLRVS